MVSVEEVKRKLSGILSGTNVSFYVEEARSTILEPEEKMIRVRLYAPAIDAYVLIDVLKYLISEFGMVTVFPFHSSIEITCRGV